MNNNQWITDRLPTDDDGDTKGYVWVTDNDGSVGIMGWEFAAVRKLAWMPIVSPEPYVKPKRFKVRWEHHLEAKGCWMVFTTSEYGDHHVLTLKGLVQNNDEHREAAERIAAIYEEVMQ